MRRLIHLFSGLALLPGLALSACQTPTSGAAAAPIPDPAGLEVRRPAAVEFQTALAAADPGLRARAVLALGRLERVDAVPFVLAALADPDPAVRREAAFAAGQLDLAFSTPAHEPLRSRTAQALGRRLASETDPGVRTAIVRALGQVADDLQPLVALASSPGPLRATALTALGVAGQRRGAPLASDPALRGAIASGLADRDGEVVTAAAYAAFRQRVVLDEASVTRGLRGPPQARIHLARAVALKATPAPVVGVAVVALARDEDWRVQVEAVRAVREHPDVDVTPLLDVLPDATRRISQPGAAHVITESCVSLAVVGAPGPALAVIELTVAGLPPGPTWTMARCTCAGVVEILGGPGNALEQCTAAAPVTTQRLLSVDTIARARISSTERAAALKGLVDDDNPKVRIAVAGALCSDGSEASADVAATRLLVEEDSGVMSALLTCFADGRHPEVLKDRTLLGLVARLQERSGFEQLEPLITVATMARRRSSTAMKDLATALAAHADAAVRDAAADVAFGDRAPGPRAVVVPAPSPATLPLGAVLRTTRGEIVIAFDREAAPRTVKAFAELARKGVLDNTPFHRVIADFVAQGGDPRGDGSGGPGYTIPNENHAGAFVRGAIGIATAGTDTGGSQFFLTHSDQPHLDGRYTRFATVVDGLAVMDSLQRDDQLLAVDFTTALRPRPTTPSTTTTATP
jgi:cyclophilin family peptidyl-prolyl cis-trans isomerase/HEAT repeat protein